MTNPDPNTAELATLALDPDATEVTPGDESYVEPDEHTPAARQAEIDAEEAAEVHEGGILDAQPQKEADE
jgi:hypothetical protein